MTKLSIETQKVKQCGEDIMKLSEEYLRLIHDFYKRIADIPTVTGEWRGVAAEKFAAIASLEEPMYKDLGDAIREYGATMKMYASMIKSTGDSCKVGSDNS